MKKFLCNISALMTLLLGFTACAPTEVDDVFDESAAVRLDKAIVTYRSYFADKGGKWVMQYFCNENEPGYAFVVTFSDNGSVTVAGDNKYIGGYRSDVSLWDIVADNGPVLTFNTYNRVLHTFSDPADIPDTGDTRETGRGHEGDYEFMVMATTDNSCVLRGKKTGYTIIMNRLDSGIDDQEYMTAVTNRINSSFSSEIDSLYLETGAGVRFVVKNAASQVMSFYPYGKDAVTFNEKQNCVVTPGGIRFLHPLDFVQDHDRQQEIAIQNFAFQPDGTLLCTDDGKTRIVADPLATIFTNGVTWNTAKETLGGNFLTLYEQIEQEIPVVFKNSRFGGFSLTFNKKTEKMTMLFLSGRNAKTAGNIYFDLNRVDDNTFRLSIDTSNNDYGDNNGRQHYTKVESFKKLVDLLTSTDFTLSADNVMCPNPMKATSKANADDVMTLTF